MEVQAMRHRQSKYADSVPEAYIPQEYLPEELRGRTFTSLDPSDSRGKSQNASNGVGFEGQSVHARVPDRGHQRVWTDNVSSGKASPRPTTEPAAEPSESKEIEE